MPTRSSHLAVALAACLLVAAPASAEAPVGIVFTMADDGELSRALRAQFVVPMTALAGSAAEFAWARVDVDGDGYDELFISLTAGHYCSDAGCPVLGFRRAESGSWPAILTVVATGLSKTADGDLVVHREEGDDVLRYDDGAGMMLPAPPS